MEGDRSFMDDDQKHKEVPSAQRPRSPRVPVNFTVEIQGYNARNEAFQVQAEAVRVSRGGATLIAEVEVEAGTVVSLTPPFGRALEAEINGVWKDETDGRQRIGVRLLDPNGWFAE